MNKARHRPGFVDVSIEPSNNVWVSPLIERHQVCRAPQQLAVAGSMGAGRPLAGRSGQLPSQ